MEQKNKPSAKKTISFRVTEETERRCKTLFPNGCNDAALTQLIDAAENAVNTDETAHLQQRIAALEAANKDLQAQATANTANTDETAHLQQRIDALEAANKDLQAQATANTANAIILPPQIENLLQTTAQKLSERYNTAIAPADVLAKMFIRYTVERYTEWFYPFVLRDSEIETITGKTVAAWKNFIRDNQKNQNENR